MLTKGIPVFLERPLEFLVTERLTTEEAAVLTRIERLRAALMQQGAEQVRFYDSAIG